jgi:hypothetical protein
VVLPGEGPLGPLLPEDLEQLRLEDLSPLLGTLHDSLDLFVLPCLDVVYRQEHLRTPYPFFPGLLR